MINWELIGALSGFLQGEVCFIWPIDRHDNSVDCAYEVTRVLLFRSRGGGVCIASSLTIGH